MALIKTIDTPSGTPAAYHRIGAWSVEAGDDFATVLVQSYADEATRRSTFKRPLIKPGAPAGATWDAPVSPIHHQRHTVPVTGDPTREDLYAALKAAPAFADATDA